MAPAKKNLTLKHRNDETPSGRRSSLQVNLSFVSSLSDSGNGSFKSQMESDEVTVRRNNCKNPGNSMSNIPEDDNPGLDVNEEVLNTIRSKERALSQSCQLLKDAILHKTKEIFDQRAEFAVKTTSVLKGQRQALQEIKNGSRSVKSSTKNDSIKTSPSSKSICTAKKSNNVTKSIQKSVERVSRADASLILSGSSKSHRKTLSRINDKLPTVRLTGMRDSRLQTSSESSQSSQSRILDDIGAPITCSSFISGYERSGSHVSQRAESESRENTEDSDAEDAAAPSVQTLTPTEITAVHVPVLSSKKRLTRLNSSSSKVSTGVEKTPNRSSLREISMELTTVQSHIPFRESSGSTNTARTSLNVNTSVHESPSSPPKRICDEASVVRRKSSSQLSLRVNTSLRTEDRLPTQEIVISDDAEKTSIMRSIEKSDENCNGNNTDPMEDMSLIAKLRNISGKKATKDIRKSNRRSRNFLGESPSFVEGTPFHRKHATEAETSRNSNESSRSSLGSFVEGTPYPPSRSILWRTQLKSATFNTRRNRAVEKAAASVAPPKKSSGASDSGSSMSTEYLTAPNDTVLLGDSPNRFTPATGNTQIIPDSSDEDAVVEVAKTQTKSAKDLPNDVSKELPINYLKDVLENFPMANSGELSGVHSMESARDLPKDTTTKATSANTTRPRKKKLYTMQENLELVSFSPVSPAISVKASPKQKVVMRRRRLQKRKAARAVAAKRIESMREDDEDELVPACSPINKVLTAKEKNPKKPRKIISKKIVVNKIVGLDIMQELEARERNCSERESTAGRDSLNDFSKKKTLPLSGRNTRAQKLVIVATGFTKGDVDLVKRVVKDLGGAEISSTVSRRTTHVVSTGVRTINLLRGIIRGCWLVSFDWVLKSLEERKWLNAEDYEMVHFSKAVQENRRDKQLFGKSYVPELFVTCGPIYIQHGSSPPPAILKELVKTAGGRIAENVRDSKLSVGPEGLREIWVLDSITTGDLQPIADYQRR